MTPSHRNLVAAALLAAAITTANAPGAARAAGRAGDQVAEAAFREAREYTVKVRVRVETPFYGDEAGTWTGAGFLVDAQRGWIVTNAHVAAQSPADVEIAFAGEPYRRARRLYVDSFADIAVLSLDGPVAGRRAARMDRTAAPEVGETVGAFGHPLGIPFTGTRGIVSGYTDQVGPDFVQVDATIDHGNSGGPVIGFRDGRVLGIATAGALGDKHDRLNFATPVHDLRRILELLRSGRSPCPPMLRFALYKDYEKRHTMAVARTFDPARWPFEPGDRIVAVEGYDRPIGRLHDLVVALRGRAGEVGMVVERGGRPCRIVVRPALREPITDRRGIWIDGALIGTLDVDDDPDSIGARPLILHSVAPSSAASSLELGSLDIVHRLDGRAFTSLDSLISYVQSRPPRPLRLEVRRGSGNTYRNFEYHARELPGEDVKLVGPETGAKVASR